VMGMVFVPFVCRSLMMSASGYACHIPVQLCVYTKGQRRTGRSPSAWYHAVEVARLLDAARFQEGC
jgi:hypothetical protein